ncbi:MAG: flagellar basal body rod protein FlgB [Myxococcota bacterium]|jgi:flagellar basal-body rod protein FlgB
MRLFDNTLTVLERALDVRLERQNVLASNAANIDTPGFTEKDVDFDRAMQGALAADGGEARHAAVRAATREVEDAVAGLDGNGVDLDRTMSAMAENGLQYSAAARAVARKLALLKYVANDGIG